MKKFNSDPVALRVTRMVNDIVDRTMRYDGMNHNLRCTLDDIGVSDYVFDLIEGYGRDLLEEYRRKLNSKLRIMARALGTYEAIEYDGVTIDELIEEFGE